MPDGKIKVFMGIDRIRKRKNSVRGRSHTSLANDSVNRQQPNRIALKSFDSNKPLGERLAELSREEEGINWIHRRKPSRQCLPE